jgi:hypothetical protein
VIRSNIIKKDFSGFLPYETKNAPGCVRTRSQIAVAQIFQSIECHMFILEAEKGQPLPHADTRLKIFIGFCILSLVYATYTKETGDDY